MKLLYCPLCQDVRRIWPNAETRCVCRASSGRYVEGKAAEFTGEAIPLGIGWAPFRAALAAPDEGERRFFNAFVFPRGAPNIQGRAHVEEITTDSIVTANVTS